jgi:hypothetical protein
MWTPDQCMHLLAVLAWPAVAVIAGLAWVHGCHLLLEAVNELVDGSVETVAHVIPSAVGKICVTWMQTTARAAGPVPVDWEAERVAVTSERALLAVLAARGGFPAKQSEEPGRALVRAIREMYSELDRPTPRPEPTAVAGVGEWSGELETADGMDGVDGEMADDLYAQFVATDDDAAQPADDEMEDLE